MTFRIHPYIPFFLTRIFHFFHPYLPFFFTRIFPKVAVGDAWRQALELFESREAEQRSNPAAKALELFESREANPAEKRPSSHREQSCR